MTEQVKESKFKFQTSALQAYTIIAALVLIWVFFHYATAQNTPALSNSQAILPTFLMMTVIKDGYAKYEDVYANVPANKRPPK